MKIEMEGELSPSIFEVQNTGGEEETGRMVKDGKMCKKREKSGKRASFCRKKHILEKLLQEKP